MKRKKLLKLCTLMFVSMIVVMSIFTAHSKGSDQDLLMQNIEALTQPENPLDHRIWRIKATSSVMWDCYPGGTNACPAP